MLAAGWCPIQHLHGAPGPAPGAKMGVLVPNAHRLANTSRRDGSSVLDDHPVSLASPIAGASRWENMLSTREWAMRAIFIITTMLFRKSSPAPKGAQSWA